MLTRLFNRKREPPKPALVPADYPSPDHHPALTYLARLSPGSRPAQRAALDRLARLASWGSCDHSTMPWHQLRYHHTQALRSKLADVLAPATCNRYLSALRGVLRECWRLDLLDADLYGRAVDVGPVRGDSAPAGRALDDHELAALLVACSGSRPIDLRDRSIIAVLAGAGLRRRELVQLDFADYQRQDALLLIKHGKGSKRGNVPLHPGVVEPFERWLAHRGPAPGPLYLPINKAGRLIDRRLTGQAVRYLLVRRAAQAGLEPVSPHDLRRTFISRLLDAGVDLATTQRLARHADLGTTARYDRRDEATQRRAVARLTL